MVGSDSSIFKGTDADIEFKDVLQGLTLDDAMVCSHCFHYGS